MLHSHKVNTRYFYIPVIHYQSYICTLNVVITLTDTVICFYYLFLYILSQMIPIGIVFMFCFVELKYQLETGNFSISVCTFVSANTHTLYVYPCAHIQYVSLCLKVLVNLDLTVCGGSLKTSALLQLTLSAAKD